jgi:integrase
MFVGSPASGTQPTFLPGGVGKLQSLAASMSSLRSSPLPLSVPPADACRHDGRSQHTSSSSSTCSPVDGQSMPSSSLRSSHPAPRVKQRAKAKPANLKIAKKKKIAEQRKKSAVVSGGLSVLQTGSVKPTTERRYQELHRLFMAWLLVRNIVLGDVGSWDHYLTEYLDALYLDGEDLSLGKTLLAAIIWIHPAWHRQAAALFPQSRQALRGWHRLNPPQARLPLPWEAVAAVACFLCGELKYQAALMLILSFVCYLRPSEPYRLRVRDIVLGTRGYPPALVLHPSEMHVPSKTQEFDESIQIDLAEHSFLNHALELHLQLRRRGPDELAFSVTQASVKVDMERVAVILQLQPLGDFHPYRLRHGGASQDFALGRRTLAEVQRRGRWRSFGSVRRYEKGGRLSQLLGALQPRVLDHAARCASVVGEVLCMKRRGPELL